MSVVCQGHSWLGGGRDGGGDGMQAGQSLGVGRMSGDAGEHTECSVNTPMTPDHTAFHVRRSGYGRTAIGRSSWEGPNTGRHEMAHVRCPCSRLTTLHCAPRTPA